MWQTCGQHPPTGERLLQFLADRSFCDLGEVTGVGLWLHSNPSQMLAARFPLFSLVAWVCPFRAPQHVRPCTDSFQASNHKNDLIASLHIKHQWLSTGSEKQRGAKGKLAHVGENMVASPHDQAPSPSFKMKKTLQFHRGLVRMNN